MHDMGIETKAFIDMMYKFKFEEAYEYMCDVLISPTFYGDLKDLKKAFYVMWGDPAGAPRGGLEKMLDDWLILGNTVDIANKPDYNFSRTGRRIYTMLWNAIRKPEYRAAELVFDPKWVDSLSDEEVKVLHDYGKAVLAEVPRDCKVTTIVAALAGKDQTI